MTETGHTCKRCDQHAMSMIDLKTIGDSLFIYGSEYGSFPDCQTWQDELIEHTDIDEEYFKCRNTKYEGSTYALNKDVCGKKIVELSDDMVVAFEAEPPYKGAKNITGGPEILTIANHSDRKYGCYILFNDGRVAFERTEDLPKLKWSLDASFVFPMQVIEDIENIKPDYNIVFAKFLRRNIWPIFWLYVTVIIIGILIKQFRSSYFIFSILTAMFWALSAYLSYSSALIKILYLDFAIWIIASLLIHYISSYCAKKYPAPIKNELPVYIGIATGAITGLAWILIVQLCGMEFDTFIRGTFEPVIIFHLIRGLLKGIVFGALQGYLWKKVFVDNMTIKEKKSEFINTAS
jgi:hypothetical protein